MPSSVSAPVAAGQPRGGDGGVRATARRRSGGAGVVGVLGELLITAGVFVLLFIGWQVWLNDLVLGSEQNGDALNLSRDLGVPTVPVAPPSDHGAPVVGTAPAETEKFATVYIPRFGADYVRTIAEGVGTSDVLKTGIGHYPDTQMPGEVGNFALAAHRTTYGAPFHEIASLQVGDRIYVQTVDGWYTYVFNRLQYVKPTGVDVLEPVPEKPGEVATQAVLTMTSCNPMFSAAERIVAYSLLDSWQPASAGPPAEVAALATSGA